MRGLKVLERGKPFGGSRAGLGPVAKPVLQFFQRAGIAAPGGINPGQTGLGGEHDSVRNAAVAIPLKPNAAPARHFRDLAKREDQEFPVSAYDCDVIAGCLDTEFRFRSARHIQDLLALACVRNHIGFLHDETTRLVGNQKQAAIRLVDENIDDVLPLIHIDHEADRLAVPASSRELGRRQA